MSTADRPPLENGAKYCIVPGCTEIINKRTRSKTCAIHVHNAEYCACHRCKDNRRKAEARLKAKEGKVYRQPASLENPFEERTE